MATDHEFLREQRLRFATPWIMPQGDYYGSARINIERAKAAGLTYRPLARSTWDTLEWWWSDAVTDERRQTAWLAGRRSFPMTLEREAEIIAAWKRR